MTKKTKIYFALLLCLIILCAGIGAAVRNSYTGYHTFHEMEMAEDLQDYHIQMRDAEEDVFLGSVKDYRDLAEGADLIAKVCATKERKLSLYASTKTKAIVRKVYQGSCKEGQEIYIYEPAGFSYVVSKYYDTIGGYRLMEEGEEYYVFLKGPRAAKGYHMSEEEKNTFLPSTAAYSKFPVRQGKLKLLDAGRLEDGQYSYGETGDLEIITSEQEILSKYRKIKKEVFADLHG